MLISLEQIVIAGIHLGHPVRRWNPKMAPYIYGVKNGSHLIDLVRTRNQLNEARHFLTIIAREGKCALFVRDKTHIGRIAIDGAFSSQSFFVRGRWLGGTLTNWATIQISLLQLHSFIRSKKKCVLTGLKKKNITSLQKRIIRLNQHLDGLRGIHSIPGVAIFFKQKASRIAIQESRKLKIPTICILDTDCDPDLIDFGIPINDDSIVGTKLFLESILPSIQEGRRWWIAKIVKKQKKISFCAYRKRTRTYRHNESYFPIHFTYRSKIDI